MALPTTPREAARRDRRRRNDLRGARAGDDQRGEQQLAHHGEFTSVRFRDVQLTAKAAEATCERVHTDVTGPSIAALRAAFALPACYQRSASRRGMSATIDTWPSRDSCKTTVPCRYSREIRSRSSGSSGLKRSVTRRTSSATREVIVSTSSSIPSPVSAEMHSADGSRSPTRQIG